VRRLILALLVAALLAGPTALAFFSGGFFDGPRLVAAAGAWAILAVAATTAPAILPRAAAGRTALAALAGLTAWTGASLAWAPLSAPATEDLQRNLLYLGAFAAAIALLRAPRTQRAVEPALAAGVLVVVGYGLSGRLLPGVIHQTHSNSALGRLEQPLTYWNAEGALAALGFILCARIAGDESRGRAARALAAAGSVPLAVGTYLSFSRGALAAAVVGGVVLAALLRNRAQLRALALCFGLGALAAVIANALPTVRALGPGDATAQGLVMLVALVVLCACAAAVQLWAGARLDRALAIGGAVVLIGAGAALALGDKAPSANLNGANAARFGSLKTTRTEYWKAALEGFAREPVVGLGSGGFAVEWLKDRRIAERARDAHSLYLETLSELGLVGIALLVAFFGGIAAAARRAVRRGRAAAAGAIAACAVFAVHAALDWDWEMPAATLPALLLAGMLVAMGDTRSDDPGDAGTTAPTRRTAVAA
jgi:hypothetical protein